MDMETRFRVICTKDKKQADPDRGLVNIHYVWNDQSGRWESPSITIFISGKAWIYSSYQLIDTKYEYNQPFELLIQKTKFPKEESTKPNGYIEWSASGVVAKGFSDSELIPVYKCECPSIQTHEFNPPVEIKFGTKFFILEDENIYGPFSLTESDGKILAVPHEMPLGLEQDHICSVPEGWVENCDSVIKNNLHSNRSDSISFFVTSFNEFKTEFQGDWECIDFISDARLIKYAGSMKDAYRSNESILSKKDIVAFMQAIAVVGKNSNSTVKERLARAAITLVKCCDAIAMWGEMARELAQAGIRSKEGERLIEKEVDKKIKEMGSSDKRLNAALKKQDANEIKMVSGELESLRSNLAVLEERKKALENEISDQEKAINENFERAEILKSNKQLKKENKRLEDTNAMIVGAIGNLKNESLINETLKQYLQFNVLGEVIGGFVSQDGRGQSLKDGLNDKTDDPVVLSKQIDLPHNIAYIKKNPLSTNLSPMDIVAGVSSAFNKNGFISRSDHEIANILICLQQSFITMFCGRPGSGKTSTSINLARSMGIDEFPRGDFLNVSVGRGWTSTRDLIGYYNGLRGEFSASKTGMYGFLKSGNQDEAKGFFRIVLLDEANLSSIEHYWSDFISMCDEESLGKSIDLGCPNGSGVISPNKDGALRFIATINNDETTEIISPRLIDRAPIISTDSNFSYGNFKKEYKLNGTITSEAMKLAFSPGKVMKEIGRFKVVDQFIKKCSETSREKPLGPSIYISGRKMLAVRKYLDVASRVMIDMKAAEDFAIAQFILPLINSESQEFRDRLVSLCDICNKEGMSRSSEILDRIISEGDIYMHSYSFF